MRVPQPLASRGSQMQLQNAVADGSGALDAEIRATLSLPPDESIRWVSPVAADQYAEYRDHAFLTALGLDEATFRHPLKEFWPRGGPRWDGLARTESGKILLIEAKSHIAEMGSVCRASETSRRRIAASMDMVRRASGSSAPLDLWMQGYYQFANRLAHLYWLRDLNGIDAHLVFVYFVNDATMRSSPKTAAIWHAAINTACQRLGLSGGALKVAGVHDVFFDVGAPRA